MLLDSEKSVDYPILNYQIFRIFRFIFFIIFIYFGIIYSPVQTFSQKQKKLKDDTTNLIDDVKEYSQKDNFFSKLIKTVIVDDNLMPNKVKIDPDRKIIKQFSGKIIRNIKIDVIDLFGASVDYPNDTIRGWFERKGNSLHIDSKEWLIKNMLIFSEGDVFNPKYVDESERIIRQAPYIYDARIIPQKISSKSDSVDIIVYVQDIWSIDGTVALSPSNKSGAISFKDINFLGFGNEFEAGFEINPRLNNGWDWDGSYLINNIYQTFISTKIYYLSDIYHQHFGAMVSRDFITPVMKWGGGISQHWESNRYPNLNNNIDTSKFNQSDYWLGYAFGIREFDNTNEMENRFNIAGRIIKTDYTLKPKVDTLNKFQDNTLYLGRIGFSDRTYYQDNYIFGLGRTEDIPIIKMFEILLGYENGENTHRPYLGLKTGISKLNKEYGYLYGGFQIGSFLGTKTGFNHTSILEVLYFSNLYEMKQWKLRHYIGSRFTYVYNPVRIQDIININNEAGIRGFYDELLRGNKKLVLNYEADLFIPLKFLGFKIALIMFADAGLISTDNSSLFSSQLYQGYGLGLRIKNEHLIFPPIQIMFGYYPNTLKSGESQFNVFNQSAIYYRFNQFQFSIPSTITPE